MNCHTLTKNTGVLTLAATMLLLSGCKSDKEQVVDTLPQTITVGITPVQERTTSNLISVSGTLVADKTAPLSFLVPGRVSKVLVDEGDKVTAGQLLATIEAQDYQNRLDMAKATVLRAKDAYQRYEPLYKEGAFTEKNIIELKAALQQATASRNIAAKALKDTKLYASISGIVGSKNIEIGQMASVQQPAFTIVKTDRIYARVPVPETEIDQVPMGKPAKVFISALNGREFNGTVSMIGAVADEQSRTYPVKIALENSNLLLRPGMIVRAEIASDHPQKVLTVPGVAIVRDAVGLPYVYVVDSATNTAQRHRVVVGNAEGDGITIKSGVKAGENVVTSGQNQLSDGVSVSLSDGSDAGEEK